MTKETTTEKDNFLDKRLFHIQNKKRNNLPINYKEYTHVMLNECKLDGNYPNAEEAYRLLLNHMDEAVEERGDKEPDDVEIETFHKATLILTRYAPDPKTAVHYTEHLLSRDPDLRSELTELKCMNNLILQYKMEGSHHSMKKALDIIKSSLDRMAPFTKYNVDNVPEVFVTLSKPVLQYHRLKFSSDMTRLIPFHS